MSEIKWFGSKICSDLKTEPGKLTFSDNVMRIPVKYVCISLLEISKIDIRELQIESDKIKFYFKNSDLCDVNAEISFDEIRKFEYSTSNKYIRLFLQKPTYEKFFSTHKRCPYIYNIFFILNITDSEIYNSLIAKLVKQNSNIISTVSQKVDNEFTSEVLSKLEQSTVIVNEEPSQMNNTKSHVECKEYTNEYTSSQDIKSLSAKENGDISPRIAHSLEIDKKSIKRIHKRLEKNSKKGKLSKSYKYLYAPSPSHSIEITYYDLLCLSPKQYLNDNIINMYLTYIYYEKLSKEQQEETYLFNVFFNTKLIGTAAQQKVDTAVTRHARVAKWTKKVDIFSKNFILIPVIEDEHWFLVIICFPWMSGIVDYSKLYNTKNCKDIPINETVFAKETRINRLNEIKKQDILPMPCILIFDSLENQIRKNKLDIIREYLKSEWDARRMSTDGPLTFDNTTCRGFTPIILKQDNGTDCGLYLLQYVESFFKNEIKSFTKDQFRKNLKNWFTRDTIEGKREEIRSVIMTRTKEILIEDDNDNDADINID